MAIRLEALEGSFDDVSEHGDIKSSSCCMGSPLGCCKSVIGTSIILSDKVPDVTSDEREGLTSASRWPS